MIAALLMLACAAGPQSQALFTDDERAAIVRYWTAPGRYTLTAPADAATKGTWQVRLTPDGSMWFWLYQRAVAGPGKVAPTIDVKAGGQHADWERWVQAKLDYDRAQAQIAADAANSAARPGARDRKGGGGPTPVAPGPIPSSLLAAVGNPPAFAAARAPMRHVVTFDDGDVYAFHDHTAMRPRYAYYRSDHGVMDSGRPLREMPDAELTGYFEKAGLTTFETHVMKAVSRLEGGFDAVNTYDTGWVSVGFIQCITAEKGDGSLLEVLAREKAEAPGSFQADYRRFGIDVTQAGILTVVDPSTGAELVGADAVRHVIQDKRLIAVFQRAGRRSTAFNVAQIRTAKAHYWPGDDPFTITVNGRTLSGTVSDVVKSEAGMAVLFDRKVNRGSIAPFADVVSRIATEKQVESLDDLTKYERQIVSELKYRRNYLEEPGLTKP